MLKKIVSVVVGYVVWTVIFLAGGAAVRAWRPDVHDANGITADVSTLVVYLVLSILASLAAGFATAQIAGHSRTWCAAGLAICLLATGIPVQLSAWNDLPVWYNLVFLIMLVPATMLGALLARPAAVPLKHAAS
jgi:hypothetical protein